MMDDPVDAIMAVMREAFENTYGEAWNRRQVSDALTMPSTHFTLSGQDEGGPVIAERTTGFTLSRHAADEEELLLVAVRPDFRGKGVGKELLRDFVERSKSRGTTKIFLEMRAGNPAEHLYREFGFVQIGVRPGYYRGAVGGPLDAITFALDLE